MEDRTVNWLLRIAYCVLRKSYAIRNTQYVIIAFLLAFLLLLPVGAVAQAQPAPANASQAQSQLTVDEQRVEPKFPDMVDFTLKAHGFETLGATLNYRLVGESVTASIDAEVSAATTNPDLHVTLDLSTHYIPPGSQVTYYWTLKGKEQEVETPENAFQLLDDAYKWNSLSDVDKQVTVHWYRGDTVFGAQLRDTASDALGRLERNTGVQLQSPADVWVYDTQHDLLGALPLVSTPEWVGGRAFPGLAIVLAAVSGGSEDADAELKRIIPHELSHLLLYQATRNPYNSPPAWLDEGLAMYNQESQDPSEDEILRQAAENGAIRPLKSLSGSFGAYEDDARAAYAQSGSVVDFLLSDSGYGPDKFAKTVAAFREGVTFDEALMAGLGATTDQIDRQWRASLPYKVAAPATPATPVAPAANSTTANTPAKSQSLLDPANPAFYPMLALGVLFAGLFLAGGALTLVAVVRKRDVERET